MLVDIVSKNGNLLLSIPIRGDGTIDDKEVKILEGITAWMDINKESIFGTRPWILFGEGPSTEIANPVNAQGFNEGKVKFGSADIRFNQKENSLYVTILGVPTESISIKSLSKKSNTKIKSITLLGSEEKLAWTQGTEALKINKPKTVPNEIATVFKVELKNEVKYN
jgi:alpha-L-fucosidase